MTTTNVLDIVIDAIRSEVHRTAPRVMEADDRLLSQAAEIARQNKVLSLVRKRLLPANGQEAYFAELARTMAGNCALLDELCRVSWELKSAGIAFAVIKGPLQQKVFHGDFFQRASADLDILVRPRDYRRAKAVLLRVGYQRNTPSVWWRCALGEEHLRQVAPPFIAVDLHHRVHQPGTPAPYNGEILFDGLTEVGVRSERVPTLDVPCGLLLCAISIAKALYNREPTGAYLCDLYAGLMAASPGAVNGFFTMARRVGLGGHAAVALRLMSAVFDIPQHIPQASDAFGGIADADLCRIVFLPRDRATIWPKRRSILWTLCEQRPLRYGRELVRIVWSEVLRRSFERPMHSSTETRSLSKPRLL